MKNLYFSAPLRRKKSKAVIDKVYRSAFGSYYILGQDLHTQEQLKEAYEKQNSEEVSS